MKVKITERDLSRIVKKVIKENMNDNDLYSGIMDVIRNSNASREETLSVLKNMVDEMESSMRMRRDIQNRWDN
jgi:hypothetical protein